MPRGNTGQWMGVREKKEGNESEKENEREALFSVVKGGTGLSRFFCRTGKLLIFLGRGRVERERKKNAGTGGRRDERSRHKQQNEELGGTDGVQDSSGGRPMKERGNGKRVHEQRK